ncbi:MAG: hypothetical protein EBX35_05200 [Planctomycetia bacterium]|nr:hypothetical protein [Planctomycetia bacterium]
MDGTRHGRCGRRRILVVCTRYIGDTVLAIPFLRNLRRAFPDATIDVCAEGGARMVLADCPYVDELIAWRRPAGRRGFAASLAAIRTQATWLAGRGYDRAYLLKRSLSGAILATLAGIPHRVGFAADGRALLHTAVAPARGRHQAARYLDLRELDHPGRGCPRGGSARPAADRPAPGVSRPAVDRQGEALACRPLGGAREPPGRRAGVRAGAVRGRRRCAAARRRAGHGRPAGGRASPRPLGARLAPRDRGAAGPHGSLPRGRHGPRASGRLARRAGGGAVRPHRSQPLVAVESPGDRRAVGAGAAATARPAWPHPAAAPRRLGVRHGGHGRHQRARGPGGGRRPVADGPGRGSHLHARPAGGTVSL